MSSPSHHAVSASPSRSEDRVSDEESPWDDLSEYDVEPSPLSSPERGVTRCRLAKQLSGEVKRLKIELPPAVIRSYLDDGTRSLNELPDIDSLRRVADRAAIIVRVCRATPVQAFYYCVDYPEGSPEAFLDLRRRMNLVFHLEGMRIMHMLTAEDREKLVETPLADVLEEFRNRDARLMVLSELKRRVDEGTALEILYDASTQGRVSLGGEETALAGKLLQFWEEKEKPEMRRERLREGFASYEMQLRDQCAFCNAYIDGKVDADVEDVIGISVIASRLTGRRKGFSRYLPPCEEKLRKYTHYKKLELEQAVQLSMRSVRAVERQSGKQMPTMAALLAQALTPSNYLPFSVLVLRNQITDPVS